VAETTTETPELPEPLEELIARWCATVDRDTDPNDSVRAEITTIDPDGALVNVPLDMHAAAALRRLIVNDLSQPW
jgi:hypothetical protein